MDDFERNGFSVENDDGLFGTIASLVEGQGCKVMLVTNDFSKMGEAFREKLVWKRYRFESDPAELIDAACFASGDAISQKEIYGMAMNLENRAVLFSNPDAMDWVRSLLREMSIFEPATRMGLVRRRWTVDALEKLTRVEDGRVSLWLATGATVCRALSSLLGSTDNTRRNMAVVARKLLRKSDYGIDEPMALIPSITNVSGIPLKQTG